MSNPQQAVAAIGGAIIGFVATGFNPIGAAYGFQVGLLVGSVLYPTQLPHVYGPRLEDLAVTQAQLGGPIPYIYGTVAVPGSVIYLGCPEEVATTEELGGKGGPEQSQTTYTYFQSIALSLCEGEISGLLRVWENGELKYDMRERQDGEDDDDYLARVEASGEYGLNFDLYLGDEEQEPDPSLEAELGIGNVPGFRGLAYIVFQNRQLLDSQARRHPQFRFEVYKAVSQGAEVVFPDNITGALDGFQTTPMTVDYGRNRYWSLDSTGIPDNAGIRAYRLLDNTELEQILFVDFLPAFTFFAPASSFTVDWRSGDLFFDYFIDNDIAVLARIDPDTWETVSYVSYDGFSIPAKGCVVHQYGAEQVRTYMLRTVLLSDDYQIWSLDGVMAPYASYVSTPNGQPSVCRGYRDGTTTYCYGVSWPLLGSGTSGPIEIHQFALGEIAIEVLGVATILPTHAREIFYIQPSDIDPTWTRIYHLAMVVWDDTDDCLIFTVQGADAAAGSGQTYVVKFDPRTESVVWAAGEDAGWIDPGVVTAGNDHQTRLRNNVYMLPGIFEQWIRLDTRTGEYEEIDTEVSDELPSGLGNASQYMYDSTLNAAIGRNNDGEDGWPIAFFDRMTPGCVSLASIVSDVWERCGGDLAEIDVEDLEAHCVLGYTQTRPMPGRGLVEPLRPLGPFDQVESEGILKFPTRGKAIVHTLDGSELGVHEDDAAPPAAVRVKAMADHESPRRVRVKYIAQSRDYEPGEQLSPVRFTTTNVNEIDIDLPVVLGDDEAAQTAEIIWAEAWIARTLYEVSLDVEFLRLDPADCVGLPVDGRVYRARIAHIDDAGGGLMRRLQLLRDDDGAYTSEAVADSPIRTTTAIAIYSATGLILLDLPPLRDEDDDAGFYAAGYPLEPARAWSGAVVHRSTDGGGAYGNIGTIVNAATVGTLDEDLAAGITTIFDDANEITVTLITGEFESVTEDDLLNGRVNALAIGDHGRWEIVQFQTATQVDTDTWTLSHLLRGRRATEHNVGLGVAGDFVVLLAGGVTRLPLQLSDVGDTFQYRAVTLNTTFGSAVSQDFVGYGEALKPFSPVDIEGARDGSDNLTITWIRRGRFGQELPDGADVPLSEESEAYEVDVLDDATSPHTVLRTIEVTAETASYTAAEQITDGLTPGDPVTVRVYQISASVGRGHYTETTI